MLPAISDYHPDKPRWLPNFSMILKSRFERLNDYADADKALQCDMKIVSLLPGHHADRRSRLTGIAESLRDRFLRLEKPEDLDEAISYYGQAASISPDSLLARFCY
jgi:tetratricopeptide (TPR) repeat protein